MKKLVWAAAFNLVFLQAYCWGFYAHKLINYQAVFLLPPAMMVMYKPNIGFLSDHSVDPDKRRYAIAEEGARHYLDIDRYGRYPYEALPRKWTEAVKIYGEDTLKAHGIVPWWIEVMLQRLTKAFREANQPAILKLSAEIGHYIADSHVPLHASSNHNGQHTNQHGIHGFWESRTPELLAETEWDLLSGQANYIADPSKYIWDRMLESAAEADSVLLMERKLNAAFPADRKYAFENRNGLIVKQYSRDYSVAYNQMLDHMIERRLRLSMHSVASLWYTAWVNAGQPTLRKTVAGPFSREELMDFEELDNQWSTGPVKGKACD